MLTRASAIAEAGWVLSQPPIVTSPSNWYPTAHELDGVGDDLPADERGLHPLVAHRHRVVDGDRVELQGRPSGVPHAPLHLVRPAPSGCSCRAGPPPTCSRSRLSASQSPRPSGRWRAASPAAESSRCPRSVWLGVPSRLFARKSEVTRLRSFISVVIGKSIFARKERPRRADTSGKASPLHAF